MQYLTLKRAYLLISMYNSIVHDHICDTRLPTFETLSFFAYYLVKNTAILTRILKKYQLLTFVRFQNFLEFCWEFLQEFSKYHLKWTSKLLKNLFFKICSKSLFSKFLDFYRIYTPAKNLWKSMQSLLSYFF